MAKGSRGTCSVCARPDVVALDRRAAGGESARSIARTAGVALTSWYEHWRDCRVKGEALLSDEAPVAGRKPKPRPSPQGAPPSVALEMPELPVLPESDPAVVALRELAESHEIAVESYARARDKHDSRGIALLLPQLRRNLQLRMELLAQVTATTSEEKLLGHPDFARAVQAIGTALDDPEFHGAREAVRVALERVVGEVAEMEGP